MSRTRQLSPSRSRSSFHPPIRAFLCLVPTLYILFVFRLFRIVVCVWGALLKRYPSLVCQVKQREIKDRQSLCLCARSTYNFQVGGIHPGNRHKVTRLCGYVTHHPPRISTRCSLTLVPDAVSAWCNRTTLSMTSASPSTVHNFIATSDGSFTK